MFSGIIQNQGKLVSAKKRGSGARYQFRFKRKESKVVLGESIAVNGVCLTVAKKSTQGFEVDVLNQTLKDTNLGALKKGNRVNLERSLQYGDRIGGHFVTGHVDAVGKIISIKKQGEDRVITMQVPQKLAKFFALKGSVAIDGVSLTIQKITKDKLTVAMIPHTLEETNWSDKRVGDAVNLEVDLMSRYLLRLSEGAKPARKLNTKLNLAVLHEQGFF